MGKTILNVYLYDTETKRATLYLACKGKKGCAVGRKKGKIKGYEIMVNVEIPDSYAEINGKIVE